MIILEFHHFQDIICHSLKSLTYGIAIESFELLVNKFSGNSDVFCEFYICGFEIVVFYIKDELVKL